MPRRRSAPTWSCISEMSGDTTSVNPAVMRVGSWKQSDFPAPVGSTASTLRPASSGPSTLSGCTRNARWPNRSRNSTRAVASPPRNGDVPGDMGYELKRAPSDVRGPTHASRGETTRRTRASGLVAPIHAVAPAALLAGHFPGTARHVLALVAARADEMGLVHHAPRLGAVIADFQGVLRHADLDAVDVEHHPRLAGLFHHAVPGPAPQAFFFRTISSAASPPLIAHARHSASSVVRSRTSTRIAACGTTKYLEPSNVISTAAFRKNRA